MACGRDTQGKLRGAEPRAWDTADLQRLIYLQANGGQGLLALTTRGPGRRGTGSGAIFLRAVQAGWGSQLGSS